MTPEYKSVLDAARRADKDVSAAYRVGSRVYGTATPESDHDYVLVLNVREYNELVRKPSINVTLRGFQDFAHALDEGNIFTLECYFAPSEHILKRDPWAPVLSSLPQKNRKRAAEEALKRASSDFDKGLRLGDRKRVYHAFRVMEFAMQIVELGKIQDFASAQKIYEVVMTEPGPLDVAFTEMFETRYSYLRSQF